MSTYERALRLLECRTRSVDELRRRLIQKRCPTDEVEEVLNRLQTQHLLSDADFARQFARRKVLTAGTSRRQIVLELTRKGVSRNIAEATIDSLLETEGVDSSTAIHHVAEKKWKSLAKLDDFTRKRRLYAFLARRGFTPDEIRDAMSRLGSELEP